MAPSLHPDPLLRSAIARLSGRGRKSETPIAARDGPRIRRWADSRKDGRDHGGTTAKTDGMSVTLVTGGVFRRLSKEQLVTLGAIPEAPEHDDLLEQAHGPSSLGEPSSQIHDPHRADGASAGR